MRHGTVTLGKDGLWINEEPVILLTGSLFYFRIPRGLWRERMKQIKSVGYNAIDVYFPWNYHELSEGEWDFSGERDVAAFLEMACSEGLWMVARPGPYICSEWDGGGLPAYLFAKPEVRLRDNEPAYLRYVKGWYDRILPILRDFQLTKGGTVVMVQLENELDFFDCQDRTGYIGALKEMALEHGIDVPLIACAGQGDLAGATGNTPGVIPTLNLYYEDSDPSLESRVLQYYNLLQEQGYSLCVTETNRSHFALRRLLSAGAKMLGPYLQIGGTNFGFTNAINNWGKPISFLTSNVDFGGMFTYNGIPRPEAKEARLFSRLLKTLGSKLAMASPNFQNDIQWEECDRAMGLKPQALSLSGGGELIALPNLSDTLREGKIKLNEKTIPQHSRLTIDPMQCPLLLSRLPLSAWGLPGFLIYATGELTLAEINRDGATLIFYTDHQAEMAFELPIGVEIDLDGFQMIQEDYRITLCFDAVSGSTSQAVIHLPDRKFIRVIGLDRKSAHFLQDIGPSGQLVFTEDRKVVNPDDRWIYWKAVQIGGNDPLWLHSSLDCGRKLKLLEEMGIYRGYGWYQSTVHKDMEVRGLFLKNAADVISVYAGDSYLGTYTPSGGDLFIPLPDGTRLVEKDEMIIRAEIWGHSNFDDNRLPAMRIKSMRGIGGVSAIVDIHDLKANWRYQARSLVPMGAEDPNWPLVNWGNWSSTDQPVRGCYHRQLSADQQRDVHILHFPGIQSEAEVYIDGRSAGQIDPNNPHVDISSMITSSQYRLSVALERSYHHAPGKVFLLEGNSIPEWQLAGYGETDLLRVSQQIQEHSKPVDFPYCLGPGRIAWLFGTFNAGLEERDGLLLRFLGKNIKTTAFLNDRLISREWLPSPNRPVMVGGEDNLMFLPGPWLIIGQNTLAFMIEAVAANEPGEITAIQIEDQ